MSAVVAVDATTAGRRGRPRDERIDREITAAALVVLAETGFGGFSVAEVTMRSGVAKSTIYRRFPTRDDLIASALERLNDDLPDSVPPGSTREQLISTLDRIRQRGPDSLQSRILTHAVSEGSGDPAMAELVHDRVLVPRRQLLRRIIEAGVGSGELRPDLDADTVIPILIGPMLYLGKWCMSPRAQQVTVEGVVDILMRGMTPANDS